MKLILLYNWRKWLGGSKFTKLPPVETIGCAGIKRTKQGRNSLSPQKVLCQAFVEKLVPSKFRAYGLESNDPYTLGKWQKMGRSRKTNEGQNCLLHFKSWLYPWKKMLRPIANLFWDSLTRHKSEESHLVTDQCTSRGKGIIAGVMLRNCPYMKIIYCTGRGRKKGSIVKSKS